MKQAIALIFVLLACGCVSNQQACEQQFTTREDIALCVLIKAEQDRRAREAHLRHGYEGISCVPNPVTGGCL